MRRYNLALGDREFVIDVQELTADRFQVVVGGTSYEVTLSGDENLLKAFAEGMDVHRATAAEVFGVQTHEVSSEQRRYAKVINFGLIYGMSAYGLCLLYTSPSPRDRTRSRMPSSA